ncbi:MAG: BT4734/BF3469 family protein [Bacteroidia bacterium]
MKEINSPVRTESHDEFLNSGNNCYPSVGKHEELQSELADNEFKKIKSPVFSYFKKPLFNLFPSHTVSLVDVFHLIRRKDFNWATDKLRKIQDVIASRNFKAKNFDYVTFSGLFTQRANAYLQKHSGLLTIDFDHLKDIPNLKSSLLNDRYFETELLFTSPSGNGLKWIIPIDLTKAKHKEYFNAVGNYILKNYQVKIDENGKDISRACYLPHDPEVFINPKYL